MIIEGLLNIFYNLITLVFAWMQLPSLPAALTNLMNEIVNLIRGGLGILSVFLDQNFIKVALPIVLVVVNFDKAYKLVMFVLRKIPFLGVK